MSFSEKAWDIFNQAIIDYHKTDDVDATETNPFSENTLERLLYSKNWIDTVQWHLEDVIRDENISPEEALKIKRRIDSSNQNRTDLVEYIDDYFLEKYKSVKPKENAKINTESPAWAIDRLSILALKIYHMKIETSRDTANEEHRLKCSRKLSVLEEQKEDLSIAIDELLFDIENGNNKIKTYKQMKMYNDDSLNPVLYQKKNA
ncbi:DUF4254 domain-containing protein [Riemerella anatipestifer]|uniref:DUF4254 domain-containing protein n=1 Tax=Riemerella anatipestifer TaxID=34085 RepID=A0A1S7DT42_RIEAN|nr:DUF4254 domain-containing protein [Riemerella anatipestifer]AQY22295.1 hypothetical protein AB406_1349 [Riemerella anatipestifer]